MDFIDRLRDIATKIPGHKDHLETEEATKNALVMPFIVALGYNVFDPQEVVPEFTADVGTKRGEKVDYAIMSSGQPVLLFECKAIDKDLDRETPTQLYRYFSVTSAKFAVLTNGEVYKFFSDLEAPNRMDERPFLEVNLQRLENDAIDQLKKFAKDAFDEEQIRATATDLKYAGNIKRLLSEEWANPSEEFVRLFAKRVYDGHLTQARLAQFADHTKKAFHRFIRDRVNERLKTALQTNSEDAPGEQPENVEVEEASDVVTTEEEMEGFRIVRSIVSEILDPVRVFMRDTKSYCGVLLDDNNRKPICRLRFNFSQKYLGLFDENKNETRHAIERVTDIYRFADEIRATVGRYLGGTAGNEEP